MKHCLNDTGIIGINNPNFIILEDGSLYTKNAISLTTHESIITVFSKNIYTHEQKRIYVSLRRHVRATVVGRTKRRWAPVPTIIMENSLGPFPMQIQQLSSDMALKYNIRYFITGPGVDKPPLNYFYIEQETGNLFVTCPIDREEYPEFQLICYAMTPDGYTPEIPLIHIIKIEDDNDNTPEFEYNIYTFHVPENRTVVGQVTAADKDEPNTLHSKVKYRIISQNHQKLHEFIIDPDSGCITVALHLDREIVSAYTLHIEARDMGGEEFGLYSTAAVHIEIGDVNDNLPQVTQSMYVVEIYENIEHAEILCIPVEDKDEPRTSSWMGVFAITKGNEDNSFALRVDQQQNIGCLSTLKELDYEKSHERRLEIVVNNEAPYVSPPNSRALPTTMVSIVVKIKDQDEGPVFESCEYILYINERMLVGTVVGNYQAMDPETGNKPLRYKIIILFEKYFCNVIWFDQVTLITVLKLSILISLGGKTGNGVIVIKLAIENNYPVSTSKHYVMCKDKKPICINASDIDLPMSTMPFHFEIEKPMDLKWKLTPNDGMFWFLISTKYIVTNMVEILVHYCDCAIPSNCSKSTTNISVGAWSIPAMVMGSLAMLCKYVYAMGNIVKKWMTEDKWIIIQPVSTLEYTIRSGYRLFGIFFSKMFFSSEILLLFFIFQNLNIIPVSTMNEFINTNTDVVKTGKKDLETGKRGWHSTSELIKGGKVNHVALSLQNYFCTEWQRFTNPRLSEMVFLCGQEEEYNLAKEYLHTYNYEGKDSPTGTLSFCTGESEEEKLSFLNQPEPPFRTLVEVFVQKDCL
uniref:Cadherin domain-containing protein n=1 Tax=Pseudonaja textilis TaxID=8673 RepID=A0A670XUJ4_PSETE